MTMEICEDYTIEIDERFHRMKPWNANILVEFKGQIKGKKRIERYVKDVIRCLYPNIRRVVRIEVGFYKNLDGESFGLCSGNKKEVEIEILKHDSMELMMLVLAHELVHAKQFLKGELSPTMKNWKSSHTKVAYSRQPWELEAYRKEEELFKYFWLRP